MSTHITLTNIWCCKYYSVEYLRISQMKVPILFIYFIASPVYFTEVLNIVDGKQVLGFKIHLSDTIEEKGFREKLSL